MTQKSIMETLEVRLKGGLLLGGGGSRELNDATLRDARKEPFIPASALKGAIREQLIRLCGPEKKAMVDAIMGAEGHEERCGGGSARIYLSDARLGDKKTAKRFHDGYGYMLRIQVSIDRQARRAAHERLFHREIIAPVVDGLLFDADIDASRLDAEQRRYFNAAVRAVFALGAARTSGLGYVDMRLVPGKNGKRDEGPAEIAEASDIDLILEAVDPLCLGSDRFDDNLHTTLESIPASALRGAVFTAAFEQRGVAEVLGEADPDFRELALDPDTCVRFGDAAPIPKNAETSPGATAFTLRTCKYHGAEHGVADSLVRSFVQFELARRGVFVVPDDGCPRCFETQPNAARPDAVSRTVAAGRRPGSPEPERRVVTRVGLDAESARGKDGLLFSLELLERGTRFAARVANLGPAGRELLRDAALRGLRVGHGRGQGYGRVKIVKARAAADVPLAERLRSLDDTVRDLLAASAELAPDLASATEGHYLAATLITDLVPVAEASDNAEEAFLAGLGLAGAEIVYAQVRTGQRGGYDTRQGTFRDYAPVVRSGSVLLLRLAQTFDDALVEGLAALERRGIGARREEGFGWVRFSDDIHQPGWRTP